MLKIKTCDIVIIILVFDTLGLLMGINFVQFYLKVINIHSCMVFDDIILCLCYLHRSFNQNGMVSFFTTFVRGWPISVKKA